LEENNNKYEIVITNEKSTTKNPSLKTTPSTVHFIKRKFLNPFLWTLAEIDFVEKTQGKPTLPFFDEFSPSFHEIRNPFDDNTQLHLNIS